MMTSEDFNLSLIGVIKKHPWAIDTFPEFKDSTTEANLLSQLDVFVRLCADDVKMIETFSLIKELLNILNDEKKRAAFMQFYEDIDEPMNAGLLCTLTIKMANQAFAPRTWRTAYATSFKNGECCYFDFEEFHAPFLTAFNLFKPIRDPFPSEEMVKQPSASEKYQALRAKKYAETSSLLTFTPLRNSYVHESTIASTHERPRSSSFSGIL